MRQWRVRADLRGAPSARAADWYEAVRLLQQQPSLATVMDEYGSFALHFAAMHRASPEVVTLLLRLNPGAASCFNKSKYLPIHYAAGNGAPPECVALIWHAYPAGAEQRNGANQTAVALATQQNRCGTPTWLCIFAHDSIAPVSDTSRVCTAPQRGKPGSAQGPEAHGGSSEGIAKPHYRSRESGTSAQS